MEEREGRYGRLRATMAKRRTRTPSAVPDPVREAVERTVQATIGTRDRAQEAMDELVRGTEERAGQVRRRAETGAESVRDRVRGAIEPLRPVSLEDLRGIQRELRAINRRLDEIEERLPAKRSSGGRSSAKSRSAGRSRSKRTG
jgi:hypothetical protein